MSSDNDVTIAALIGIFLEMPDATYTLGACLLLCEVSQQSL